MVFHSHAKSDSTIENYLNSLLFSNFPFAVLGMKPWFGCMLHCTPNPEKNLKINSAIMFIFMFTYMCV